MRTTENIWTPSRQVDLGRVRVVSWDIDGTMYDLHRLMSAFKLDLVRRMFSLDWVEAWRDFFRLLRFKRHMDKVRKKGGDFSVGVVQHRAAIEQTQDAMYGRILPRIGTLEGAVELMEWFRQNGFIQVAFSDYRPSTKLTALGVESYFSHVFAGEDINHLKPSPDAFRHILKQMEIDPGALLHIGDRVDTDAAAAPVVGFQVAIIGAEYPSFNDLIACLKAEYVGADKNETT